MENYGGDVTALTNDIRSALIESSGNLASDVHYICAATHVRSYLHMHPIMAMSCNSIM